MQRVRTIVEFPEEIIHRIQSFLNGKEAAQTTLLSKSWKAAWLTRPDLHFDESDFGREYNKISFCNFVKNTVERYKNSDLKINSLWLSALGLDRSLVKEMIIEALNMGATSLHLHLDRIFTLPYEVLESKDLISLYVKGCTIDHKAYGKVRCSELKSLTLEYVTLECDMVSIFIERCPLIQYFSLSRGGSYVLGPFVIDGPYKLTEESIVDDSPFKNLKCLLLSDVKVSPLFFKGFFSKFPCLKDLFVDSCRGYKEIQILSPSLERINFKYSNLVSAKFDVPCICKFTFSGSIPPSFTFKTTKRNWESSINLQYYKPVKPSWFLRLNTFLKNLTQSKVYLSLEFSSKGRFGYFEDLQGLTKPEVESVTISGPHSLQPSIFCTLFQLCRPIYITRNWLPESGFTNNDMDINFMEIVQKRMMHQVSLNSCVAYQRMFGGPSDLEAVSVESYDESVSAWCPRSFDILISPEADHELRLRLHLRWRN